MYTVWNRCVGGRAGDQVVWRASTGVIHCVFDQIPNLQMLYHPKQKPRSGGDLSQMNTCQQVILHNFTHQTGDTVHNIENRNWKMMLTTLHLICVESLYRYPAQTNEGDGQTSTPSRCICYPPTGGLDTTLQVTSKYRSIFKKSRHLGFGVFIVNLAHDMSLARVIVYLCQCCTCAQVGGAGVDESILGVQHEILPRLFLHALPHGLDER